MNDRQELPNHEERMKVVRRLCRWELGDRGWADRIVGAYLSPDSTSDYLDREEAPK